MKKYRITLTKEQLMLIADCVEDCHRFACGQTDLFNTIGCIKSSDMILEVKERLRILSHFVNPELPPNASYDWAGNGCKDKFQRKFIAQTYAIYREILHKVVNNGVFTSPTLICEESGELPIIEEVEE